MPRKPPALEFFNVDLDLASRHGLGALLAALEEDVLVLHRRAGAASLELGMQPGNATQAIVRFAKLVAALPPRVRAQWDRCHLKSMNVGLRVNRGGRGPRLVQLELSAIEALVAMNASVAFTVYRR